MIVIIPPSLTIIVVNFRCDHGIFASESERVTSFIYV